MSTDKGGNSRAAGAGFTGRLFELRGRTALIIGGHGEIAAAMAATLADLGANVVLAARKLDLCAGLAASIEREFRVATLACACDIGVEEQVRATIDATLARFGRLDILINNAGASWSGAPQDIPLSGWNKVVQVNLTGSFIACREAARHMLERGDGSIINVASTGGMMSFTPEMGQVVPYTTTKAAVIHLTADLAAQWAAQVNAVAPGSFESGLLLGIDEQRRDQLRARVPMGRLGAPLDLAGAIAFLASDASRYVTGQTLVVDGGAILV
jgi:gluconate 5-dehydrogenase